MKPVLFIIGESASKKDPFGVLTNNSQSGRTLNKWLTVINPEDKYSVIKLNATDLRPLLTTEEWAFTVVALGKVAARTLKKKGLRHYELPHPSGRNRQLNDKTDVMTKLISLAISLEVLYEYRADYYSDMLDAYETRRS